MEDYEAADTFEWKLKSDGGCEQGTGVPMKVEVFMGCFRFLGKNGCVSTPDYLAQI